MYTNPGKDLVVKDLDLVNKHVHRILDVSIREAIEYFKQRERKVNFKSIPDLVRTEAVHLFNEYPLPNIPYQLADLSRNGLCLVFPGYYHEFYHVKILMSDNGCLPVAKTKTLDRFYKQDPRYQLYRQLFFPLPIVDLFPLLPFKEVRKRSLHLVYLWQVTNVNTGSFDLRLVCTKKGNGKRAIIDWEHPIKDIAEETKLPLVAIAPDVDDLGLSLPERLEKKQGEEQLAPPDLDSDGEDDLGLSFLDSKNEDDNIREEPDSTETDG